MRHYFEIIKRNLMWDPTNSIAHFTGEGPALPGLIKRFKEELPAELRGKISSKTFQMQDHSVPLQEGRKAVRTCMPRTEKEVRESLWLRHLNPFQPRDYRYRQCKYFKNYTNPPSSHAHARSCPHSNFHLVCCVPSFSDCPCALLPASSLWLFVFLVLGCCSFVVRSPRTPQRRERILFTSY